jgi:hypothetical protein
MMKLDEKKSAAFDLEDLKALQRSLAGLNDPRKKILDQFDIEQMFEIFLQVNKIDKRKTKPYEINKMFRAYVGGMAHVVVLTFITVFEQKQFTQEQLVNYILAQCEKYLKSIGVA